MRYWCPGCGIYHEQEDITGTYDDVAVAPCVHCGKPIKGAVPSDLPKCFHCANAGQQPYIR